MSPRTSFEYVHHHFLFTLLQRKRHMHTSPFFVSSVIMTKNSHLIISKLIYSYTHLSTLSISYLIFLENYLCHLAVFRKMNESISGHGNYMTYVVKSWSVCELLLFAVKKRFFNHMISFSHLQWKNFFKFKTAKIFLFTKRSKSFSAIFLKNHY